jgi:hypothetical protein
MQVEKSPELYPDFNDSLRNSMKEATRLFLEKVVLARAPTCGRTSTAIKPLPMRRSLPSME